MITHIRIMLYSTSCFWPHCVYWSVEMANLADLTPDQTSNNPFTMEDKVWSSYQIDYIDLAYSKMYIADNPKIFWPYQGVPTVTSM
jgi:hypothetical protein